MLVEVGKILDGVVKGITNFGAFVELSDGKVGLVHISEVAEEYVKDIKAHLHEGQKVTVKVVSVDKNEKISLSIKKATSTSNSNVPPKNISSGKNRESSANKISFEERLARFMKDSDERMLDLKKKNTESKRGGGGYKRSAF